MVFSKLVAILETMIHLLGKAVPQKFRQIEIVETGFETDFVMFWIRVFQFI